MWLSKVGCQSRSKSSLTPLCLRVSVSAGECTLGWAIFDEVRASHLMGALRRAWGGVEQQRRTAEQQWQNAAALASCCCSDFCGGCSRLTKADLRRPLSIGTTGHQLNFGGAERGFGGRESGWGSGVCIRTCCSWLDQSWAGVGRRRTPDKAATRGHGHIGGSSQQAAFASCRGSLSSRRRRRAARSGTGGANPGMS
jgi:hypothetical protein